MDAQPVFGRALKAHGILGSMAFCIFFPLGAILLRTLKSRNTVWVHAAVQAFGLALFTANAGMGIWIACQTEKVNFVLLTTHYYVRELTGNPMVIDKLSTPRYWLDFVRSCLASTY